MKLKVVVACAILCCIVCCAAWTTDSLLSISKNVSSQGTISVSAGLGIYSDSACQNSISIFNWGSITPGQEATYIVYIENTGVGVSLQLSITVSNWFPANADGPITVTWDQENAVLCPNQYVMATLTLSVSSSISDISSFSNQISITGTEVA